jgi:hypothetical protein
MGVHANKIDVANKAVTGTFGKDEATYESHMPEAMYSLK